MRNLLKSQMAVELAKLLQKKLEITRQIQELRLKIKTYNKVTMTHKQLSNLKNYNLERKKESSNLKDGKS